MGKQTKAIIKSNVNTIINDLNKALADEFLAAHQYWIGAKIVKGYFRKTVQEELEQHAKEELKHAEMLINRILQLDGAPLIDPKDWYKFTHCGYLSPKNPDSIELLKQNLEGERCAIKIYNDLLNKLRNKDEITFFMIHDILKDEEDHEFDLQTILEDIAISKK